MEKIGFIGMGNMGQAMIAGLLDCFNPSDIFFHRRNKEKAQDILNKTGINYANSNEEVLNSAKYIILAIKPQMLAEVLDEIKDKLNKEHIIISIIAGKKLDDIKSIIGNDKRVIRAMPNTPAIVKSGMSGIAYDFSVYTENENEVIDKIFNSFGSYRIVKENLIDAVVSVSGSSPAFVYMFIEALSDAGVACGLSREDALFMAAKTVEGAAKTVLLTNEHPAILKDKVCSPGGTTIEGVACLEKNGFRNALISAARACYDKCKNI